MHRTIGFTLPLGGLVALFVIGCNKSDPKADASFAKLEAESAAHKTNLVKVEDELKRSLEELKKSQVATANLSADLKKVNENINGLRLEFAKAAPGIVSLPPPKEERLEKAVASGKFSYNVGLEGSVNFGEPFTHPPTVDLGGAAVTVLECTVSGFKWKNTSIKGTTWSSGTPTAYWKAEGLRKVLPADTAKAEKNTKYGKQIAEQFLRAFCDLKFDDCPKFTTGKLVTMIRTYTNEYGYRVVYYQHKSNDPIPEAKRFQSFKISTTSLSPNGKEILCTGTLDGKERKAEFTLVLVPTDTSWRVDVFALTDKSAEKK